MKKLKEHKLNKLLVQDLIRLIEYEIAEFHKLRETTTETLEQNLGLLEEKEHYIGRLTEFLNVLYDNQMDDIFIYGTINKN